MESIHLKLNKPQRRISHDIDLYPSIFEKQQRLENEIPCQTLYFKM